MKQNGRRSMNCLSWKRLTARKKHGGLDLQDFPGFNLAMVESFDEQENYQILHRQSQIFSQRGFHGSGIELQS